jgi:hypothetical protein
MNTEEKTRLAGEQAKTTGLDFQAMGGAVMGVGMALGGLSMLFNSLGMEEEAETVSKISAAFMGLGMVLSTLPMLAKALGMSFTKAGVRISVAGHTAQLGWGWIGLIAIAIAALIHVGVALAKQEEELAKKTERLNAAYETFSENANQAKENLEQLTEA